MKNGYIKGIYKNIGVTEYHLIRGFLDPNHFSGWCLDRGVL